MGSLISNRMALTVLYSFVLVTYGLSLCDAKPGILDDLILDDECKPIADTETCLIGYDEENCNADDYEPFRVNGNGIPKNFTKPASPIKDFFGYQDGIESLILRKGCEAVLYKNKIIACVKCTCPDDTS